MAMAPRRTPTTGGERSQLQRRLLRGLALAGVVGLSLLAAACGGGSSGAKVAQIGTNSSSNRAGASNGSTAGDPTKFSACMRSHGVPNFPDPDSKGRILITSGVDANGHKTGVDTNSPQFARARNACQKFQPNGGRPSAAQQAQEQQAMLKFAHCMRSHGVPNFPDPKAGGQLVLGNKSGVDPNTPQFRAAQKTCQKLVPGGPVVAPPPAPPGGGSGSGSGSGSSPKP
jgi:hypothetical protein